jgi:hypothetical protein
MMLDEASSSRETVDSVLCPFYYVFVLFHLLLVVIYYVNQLFDVLSFDLKSILCTANFCDTVVESFRVEVLDLWSGAQYLVIVVQ